MLVKTPSQPIERSIAGPGLLAHVLVAKFAYHLPLYRQSLIYEPRTSIQIVSCWRTGWAQPVRSCAHWSTRSGTTCWLSRSCMQTTRLCQYSCLATGRSKAGGYGPMCAMIDLPATSRHQQNGSPTRQITKVSIRKPTRLNSMTHYRPTDMRGLTPCLKRHG